jgi:hypothetical protein
MDRVVLRIPRSGAASNTCVTALLCCVLKRRFPSLVLPSAPRAFPRSSPSPQCPRRLSVCQSRVLARAKAFDVTRDGLASASFFLEFPVLTPIDSLSAFLHAPRRRHDRVALNDDAPLTGRLGRFVAAAALPSAAAEFDEHLPAPTQMRQHLAFAMAVSAPRPAAAGGGGPGPPEERWVRLPCCDVVLRSLDRLPAARWDHVWPVRFAD